MATARIPVDAFERGAVPAICPITGDAADDSEAVSAVSPVGWKWLLLLVGVIPFVVVWAVTRRTAVGRLPISAAGRAARAQQMLKRFKAIGVALTSVPVAFLGWYLTDVDVLPSIFKSLYGPVAAILALGGLGAAGYFSPPTTVIVEPSGRWVKVQGASPVFAEAVLAQSMAQR